jgi:AbrB family looped-hinge helix DNA binding protein
MATVVTIDQKGRMVIPKRLREKANIQVPEKLVMVPKEEGCIEIVQVEEDLKRAKRIAAQKLRGWREEAHHGEHLLLREMVR